MPGSQGAQLGWKPDSPEFVLTLDDQTSITVVPHRPLKCHHVDLLAWLKAVPRKHSPLEANPDELDKERALKSRGETTIGRLDEENNTHQIYHEDVDLLHCVCVAREIECDATSADETESKNGRECWIVDNRSNTGTFVNHRPIIAKRLSGGDFVQIGPFQWMFNESDGFLLPVSPVKGIGVEMSGLNVTGRLQVRRKVKIKAGGFVAITGPSGSGKSTLLKALACVPHVPREGRIEADGQNIDDDPDGYRSSLGYLSQEAIVHEELTPPTILELSAAAGRKIRSPRGRTNLAKLEIPQVRWGAALAELSGGQAKRVRVACELMSAPRVLLLDEPASGLDREREASLMRILRSLSWTGCTVIVVTHGVDAIGVCDRVLFIDNSKLRFLGSPKAFRKRRSKGRLTQQDRDSQSLAPPASGGPSSVQPNAVPTDDIHAAGRTTTLQAEIEPKTERRAFRRKKVPNAWRQLEALVRRELWLLMPQGRRQCSTKTGRKQCWKRLVLPLLVVPALFAGAFTLAFTDTAKTDLLAFFCVLASIWMGASQSLMAIVGEREVFEHEHLLFLRIPPYVTAKMIVYSALAVVQSFVFVVLLLGFQRLIGSPVRLFGTHWVFLCLALVNAAAVGMGLAISALSGRSQQGANLLLPLVMIAQIVFSVYVCCEKGTLEKVYGQLQPRMCSIWTERRADMWMPQLGWTCQGARKEFLKVQRGWERKNNRQIEEKDDQRIRKQVEQIPPSERGHVRENLPGSTLSILSYLTLSRYGDIALRAFALSETGFVAFNQNNGEAQRFGYRQWWKSAMCSLLGAFVFCPIAAGSILWLQDSDGCRTIVALARKQGSALGARIGARCRSLG